jgi:hypothetical protein
MYAWLAGSLVILSIVFWRTSVSPIQVIRGRMRIEETITLVILGSIIIVGLYLGGYKQ